MGNGCKGRESVELLNLGCARCVVHGEWHAVVRNIQKHDGPDLKAVLTRDSMELEVRKLDRK